jgi:AraC-like DNA-binding protein
MPEGLQRPGRFQSFVAGLHAAPARVRDEGSGHLVHAFLTPLGVRSLFGVPANALASRVVALGALLGARARELEDRLACARSWPERFAVLDQVLARMLAPAPPAPEILWAWRKLAAAHGRLAVGALAREIGWSRRHFGERFRAEVGLAPKAPRACAFERAQSLFAAREPGGIGAVAVTRLRRSESPHSSGWRSAARRRARGSPKSSYSFKTTSSRRWYPRAHEVLRRAPLRPGHGGVARVLPTPRVEVPRRLGE